jgi:hypothetical protein
VEWALGRSSSRIHIYQIYEQRPVIGSTTAVAGTVRRRGFDPGKTTAGVHKKAFSRSPNAFLRRS